MSAKIDLQPAVYVSNDKLFQALSTLPASHLKALEATHIDVAEVVPDQEFPLTKSTKRKSEMDLTALFPETALESKRARSTSTQRRSLPGLPKSVWDEGLELESPASPKSVAATLTEYRPQNCYIQAKNSREAIEFVDHNLPGLADRVAVPASIASLVVPSSMKIPGDSSQYILLTAIKPEVIRALNLSELTSLVDALSEKRLSMRWWNKEGKLGTQSLFHSKKTVSAATALLLTMRVYEADVVCHRILTFAKSEMLEDLSRVGASSFVRQDNVATVLRDSVECIVDEHGLAVGREAQVAKAASQLVTKYMHQSHASKNSEHMSMVLRDLVATCKDIQDEAMMGAFVGVVMSGLLRYIADVQERDQKIAKGVKMGGGFALSFLEEAPGGKIASQILSMGLEYLADEVATRAHARLNDVANLFMSNLQIRVEKSHRLPGASTDLKPLSDEQMARFFRWIGHTMKANGF